MKRIILIGTLMLLPVLVMGQQSGTYRDRYGNTSGTSSRDGDRRDYRDSSGNYTGSRDRDRDRDDD